MDMRSFHAACGLPFVLVVLLLTSCATEQEQPQPSAAPAASAEAVPAAPEQTELSAALAEEAARAKEQAMAESRAREQAASDQQERPLTKEEVEAQVAAMKPKAAKEEASPLVVEKEVAVETAVAPAVAPAEETPSSPFVFIVHSAPKDPSHPYYGVGSKFGFVVNGVHGKELVMVRGKTYTFKVNTDVQHDFYLSLSRTGWGAATYSKGVEGNFTYNGVVTFTPDASTPDTLYYQCRNHKNMGSAIHVVNEGEELKVRQAAAEAARAAAAKAAQGADQQVVSVNKSQVKQKIAFADMFVNQSQAAKRISGSGNVDAFEMYRSAQAKLTESQAAFAGEQFEQALALVDESLRLMSEASRRVPSEADLEELRTRYKEMLEGTKTFEASYQRNFKRLSKQKHGKEIPQLDLTQIHGDIARAQQLAQEDNYAEAVRVLGKTQEKLNTALTEMLHEETMSYELVFDTPKEEYEYELSRYASYEELVPLAIEQRRPPQQTVDLMHKFVEKAKGIKEQALPTAAKGDYKTAILMLQGATSHIQRALRLAGVR